MPEPREFRDWQPGDGLACAYARQAPLEIPCGPPVRTVIKKHDPAGRKSSIQRRAVCSHHADLGFPEPGAVMTAAKKAATERLIVEHYDSYQAYLREAIDAIVGEPAP